MSKTRRVNKYINRCKKYSYRCRRRNVPRNITGGMLFGSSDKDKFNAMKTCISQHIPILKTIIDSAVAHDNDALEIIRKQIDAFYHIITEYYRLYNKEDSFYSTRTPSIPGPPLLFPSNDTLPISICHSDADEEFKSTLRDKYNALDRLIFTDEDNIIFHPFHKKEILGVLHQIFVVNGINRDYVVLYKIKNCLDSNIDGNRYETSKKGVEKIKIDFYKKAVGVLHTGINEVTDDLEKGFYSKESEKKVYTLPTVSLIDENTGSLDENTTNWAIQFSQILSKESQIQEMALKSVPPDTSEDFPRSQMNKNLITYFKTAELYRNAMTRMDITREYKILLIKEFNKYAYQILPNGPHPRDVVAIAASSDVGAASSDVGAASSDVGAAPSVVGVATSSAAVSEDIGVVDSATSSDVGAASINTKCARAVQATEDSCTPGDLAVFVNNLGYAQAYDLYTEAVNNAKKEAEKYNWTQHTDEHGKPYFYNSVIGSVWDIPSNIPPDYRIKYNKIIEDATKTASENLKSALDNIKLRLTNRDIFKLRREYAARVSPAYGGRKSRRINKKLNKNKTKRNRGLRRRGRQ